MLRPGGWLILEFGYGQREALRGLLEGWTDLGFAEDLQGIPRVASASRADGGTPLRGKNP
jgi:release factor glutamine methyltransferase